MEMKESIVISTKNGLKKRLNEIKSELSDNTTELGKKQYANGYWKRINAKEQYETQPLNENDLAEWSANLNRIESQKEKQRIRIGLAKAKDIQRGKY
jgi:hypothetical protein